MNNKNTKVKHEFIKNCLKNPDAKFYENLLEKQDEIHYQLFSTLNNNKKPIEIPVRNKKCEAEGMTDLKEIADFIYSIYLNPKSIQCPVCQEPHSVDINDYFVDSSFEYFLHGAKKQNSKEFSDNSRVICKKSRTGGAPTYQIISLAYQDGGNFICFTLFHKNIRSPSESNYCPRRDIKSN